MKKPDSPEKPSTPASPPVSGSDNWFARNPKKTLFLFLLGCIVALTFVTEKILDYNNRSVKLQPPMATKRFIRLGEYSPLSVRPVHPPRPSRLSPNQDNNVILRIDGDGFIRPGKLHEHPDITMAFLGGSIVDCRYVAENKRLPIVTGQILSKQLGIKINVYNGGKQGNNTLDAINILLNKVAPLQPQIVILMPGWEDLETLLRYKTYWNSHSPSSPIVDLPSASFSQKVVNTITYYCQRTIPHIYTAIYKSESTESFSMLKNKRDSSLNPIGQPIICWPEFNTVQEMFVSICEARNITPVIVTPPYQSINYSDNINFIPSNQVNKLINTLNNNILSLNSNNNIKVINLCNYLSEDDDLFIDHWQLSEAGSTKISNIIVDELKLLIRK